MAQQRGPGALRSRYPQLDGDCNENLAKNFFIRSSPLFDRKSSKNLMKTLLLWRLFLFFQRQKCRGDVNPALLVAHWKFSKQNSTILQALNKKLKQTAEFVISSLLHLSLEFSLRPFSMITSNST